MNILVTGGAGFIGSNFVNYWNRKYPGDTVVVYDKLTYAADLANLKYSKYSLYQSDICNNRQLKVVVDFSDVVVHFAAESHVDNSIDDSDPFIETNINGTHSVLKACLKCGKRLHHISTDEVFGSLDLGSSEKFTESTSYNPHSPYSASKAASDHLVRAFHDTYGLDVTISNCSNNYGPRQHKEKLIPKLISNTLQGNQSPIYGDGQNVRDWLHVEDHCSAIESIIKDGIIGETYLIGGDCELTNLQVIETIAKQAGDGRDWESYVEYVKDRPGHDRRYAIDCSKLKTQLGWSPKYTFEEGIKQTINWYKEK